MNKNKNIILIYMDIIFIYLIFFILVILYLLIDNRNNKLKHNIDYNKLTNKIKFTNKKKV